eukprot:TRINITY_DN8034_c0_g2_i2.p2 TRINITY_DN8034_c0_g2~~TRINITY_DN8034_c0_g2_i2.p2  ORF type:complete len:297 (-),score=18.76 TRINITY_DN8034_c0_g2_i2:429-1319(-)
MGKSAWSAKASAWRNMNLPQVIQEYIIFGGKRWGAILIVILLLLRLTKNNLQSGKSRQKKTELPPGLKLRASRMLLANSNLNQVNINLLSKAVKPVQGLKQFLSERRRQARKTVSPGNSIGYNNSSSKFTVIILRSGKHHGIKSLTRKLKTDNDITVSAVANSDIITQTIPVLVKRWNGRKLIIVPGDQDFPEETFEPSALAKCLAQGYQWMGMIESGKYPTIARLAEELRLDPSIVAKSINMVNLSPKIQKMIVEADTPKAINREKLFHAIPEDWEEQERVLLGQAGLAPVNNWC